MKLHCLPFVLLLFLNIPSEGQGNFKKGFVITVEGDTLKGYIDDRAWEENPEKINFRKIPEDAEEKSFDIHNAIFFQIDGGSSFQRWMVSVSMDEVEYSKLHIGVDTSKVKKTVFLKMLVDGGYVNLYSYTDAIKTRYYLLDKTAGQPVELSYRTYYYISKDFTTNPQKIVTVRNYIGQLKYVASKFKASSKELNRKIENASYLSEELSEITVLINGKNALILNTTYTSDEKLRLYFFISIGIKSSLLNYMDAPYCYEVNSESNHKKTWSPVPHFGFDLKKKTGSRLYLREDMSFSTDKLASSDQYSEPLNFYYDDYEYSTSQWNINLSNSLNYNFLYTSVIKMYAGAGVDVHFSHINSSTYSSHAYDLYNEYFTVYVDLLPPRQLWVSFPLRIGVLVKNKFEINYQYHIPVSITDEHGCSRQIKNMEIGIAYLF
jgi:hypothetical protein